LPSSKIKDLYYFHFVLTSKFICNIITQIHFQILAFDNVFVSFEIFLATEKGISAD